MNFDQRVGEVKLNTPDQEDQEAKVATENKPSVPENRIMSTSKDENFPESTIIKTQDKDGTIIGYAIRTKEDGALEGNEISYQPDGSMGAVQELSETDLAKLQQQGILGKYEELRKIDAAQKQDKARIWLVRMFLQETDPFTNRSGDPVEALHMKEATESLQSLDSAEQISLADAFFDEKIGNSPSSDSIRKLYGVYVKLKGTAFGDRIGELEDERLKKAGAGGFKL